LRTLYFCHVVSSIFFLSIFFVSLPNLSRTHWIYAVLAHMCGLSTNLECRPETCCTRLAEKYRTKKLTQIRHLRAIAQFCRAMSSQLRNVTTIGKKLLNSNISSRYPYNMVNFGPLAAEIGPVVWGTPANLNGFRVLAAL